MEVWEKTAYINYEVSNLGRVRNTKTGKILKGHINDGNGYRTVSLSTQNGTVTIEVHRLVAIAFLGFEEGKVVHHLDENKLNNKLINLEWVTQQQNVQASVRPRNTNPKLTQAQKKVVKELYSNGMSCIKITAHCNQLWGRTTTRATYTRIVRN